MSDPHDVEPLVEAIRPLLAGRPAEVQGAALADLLALLLAGHIVYGNRAETRALRKRLLAFHMAEVRRLLPVNAKLIHGDREP